MLYLMLGRQKCKMKKIQKNIFIDTTRFSYFLPLYLKVDLKIFCLTLKSPVLSLTSKETLFEFIHVCFSSTRPYTRTSIDLSVDLSSCGSIKKNHKNLFLHRY